jgi:hypothetical protein
MDSIHDHIEKDRKILDDPLVSSQSRRHTQEELEALERWVEKYPDDMHDPTSLELFCNDNPEALECLMYGD